MSPHHQESVRLALPSAGALQVEVSFADKFPDGAVLFVHGFGSNRKGEKPKALEAACRKRGWTFVTFDFRGHGDSTGTLLELLGSGLLEDLEMVRSHLATRGIRRLCLVGSSMGGWASAWFTLRHPETVEACVFIAPAVDFLRGRWARLTEAERQHWKQTGRLRVRNEWLDTEIGYGLVEEMDLLPVERLAAEWSRPLLIFHGMKDDTVPYTQSLSFVEQTAYPEVELRLFKNGDHRLLAFKDVMAEAACDFFA